VSARSYRFTPDHLVVHAGENIALQLHALDGYHTFAIDGFGHVVGASAGTTRTGGFRLQHPGHYTFYCEEPGHRANGMEGTITVVS
jgi:heme/copper-type cytochrome/quinol oxidase subunit 2